MNLYLITAEGCSQSTQGNKRAFGIAVFHNFRKVAHVHGLSDRLAFVLSLCVKFTLYQLSPLHLNDVLEDTLSEPR